MKTKILLVVTRLNIGGPAVHTILLAARLRERGYDPVLVKGRVGSGEEEMVDLLQSNGVVPVEIAGLGREISWRDDLAAFLQVRRFIRQEKPVLVHTHTSKAGVLGRLASFTIGVPVVVHTLHGLAFRHYFGRLKSKGVLLIERMLAARSACIVAVGSRQREEMLGYRLCPVQKIAVIPYGIPLAEFASARRQDGGFREELDLGPDDPLIGIIGRLAPIKGHRVFLEAARRVFDMLPRAQFVVVGDGELRKDLEDRTRQLGLEHLVHFVGYRRDLPRIYASLDVVALSSWHEGLPIALIEALAAGCYVVATDVGSVGDLIPDDRFGTLVPSGDPQALGDAICEAIKGKRTVSEEERREAMRPYGMDYAVENMDRLYRRLLNSYHE